VGLAADPRAVAFHGVEPFREAGVAPLTVPAAGREVDHVQVQGGRFVGELDEVARTGMRLGRVEQVDERNGREHPRPAFSTGRHGGGVEIAGQGEQRVGFARVELYLFSVLVEEAQRPGHEWRVRRAVASGAVRAATIVDGKIVVTDRPDPEPRDDLVIVRVHGAGLNRADLLQLAGNYPAPAGSPPDIPGLEFAGVVEATGPDATGVEIGARVFGIAGGGAHAEYLAVPAAQCAPVPDGLELVAMGGAPEAFVTAHDALVSHAHLRAGEWVLVHAVGSGVGTTALQLATAFGAKVVGTARTESKLERCRALGLTHAIVPPLNADGQLDVDALAWAVIEATDGGANVTVDLVGGTYVESDFAAAALQGRIVLVGSMAGVRATLPVHIVMAKRLTIIGTVLRARDARDKAAATAAFVRDVVPLLADGRVAPVVEQVIPLDRAADAYELVASDTTFGKVILDCR
jgi:NADPH:quinone reductase